METLFIICLSLLHIPLLVSCQSEVFIHPTTSANDNTTMQVTFADIVRNETLARSVFKSNTSLVFLPGNHDIDIGPNIEPFFRVENLTDLVFVGKGDLVVGYQEHLVSETKIRCLSPFGMAFMNISRLSFLNLTISGCGVTITQDLRDQALLIQTQSIHEIGMKQKIALFLVNVVDLKIDFFSVENSFGYGLLAINALGNTLIQKSVFYGNNIYTQYEGRCFFPEDFPNDIIMCNGGNILFLYEDLRDCPTLHLQYTVTIRDSLFALGTNINGGLLPELMLSRGTGLGMILSQSSYGVDIELERVVSFGNGALIGANFYFAFYETVENSTISIRDTLCSTGNNYLLRADNFLQISAGTSAGLFFDYGIRIPLTSPSPVCSRGFSEGQRNVLQIDNCTFHNNTAISGGGMYIRVVPLLERSFVQATVRITISNTTFSNNSGLTGGALFASEISSIGVQQQSEIVLTNVLFVGNGFITQANDMTNLIKDGLTFSALTASILSNMTIIDSQFLHNEGSAIDAYDSYLYFAGNITFDSNAAVEGGGMRLEDSFIYLDQNTHMNFINNTASTLGGAVKVATREDITLPCFFQLFNSIDVTTSNIRLYFENNFATEAGSVLYGGSIDQCIIVSRTRQNSTFILNNIVFVGTHSTNTSLISSPPNSLCVCDNGSFFCDNDALTKVDIFPGDTFYISVIALGQRGGIAPATVYAISSLQLSPNDKIHRVGKECTELEFSSVTKTGVVLLSTGKHNAISTISINVNALDCPLGFELVNNDCVCDQTPQIPAFNLECDLNTQTVHRGGGTWINASFVDLESNPVAPGVIIHFFCPFQHCLSEDSDVDLRNPDNQCAYNRTGILCGACKPGLSLSLTSPRCVKCTNNTIALLLVYLIAGILLVAVLFIFKLIISEGTLGGLIFYANIVQTNMSIFFPQSASNVLTVFISWLNLEIGIEACFYDGMDAYGKTWLTYVFPLYLWFIAGVIYVASQYSTRVSRLCGSSAVAVLASLFLMSYNKLLIDVYMTLAWTVIQFPNGDFNAVWSLDGNIHFNYGRHIPLAIFGMLVLVFFLIPYVLLLVFVPLPCIQAHTNRRALSWVNKLKPFFDSHYSPYKDRYRNWSGVLLLVRIVYTLIVSINILNDTALTLLVLSILSSLLLAIAWISGGVYKNWLLNVLEGSFYLNLSLLSGSVFYVLKTNGNLEGAIYTSVSIALLEFLIILSYHVWKTLSNFKKVKSFAQKFLFKRRATTGNTATKLSELDGSTMETIASPSMTYTDLREPLLDDP